MGNSPKEPILFVLSMDTEEQWDWSGPFPHENFNVSNVNQIPIFQEMCNEIGVKPTYFVDYAVAASNQCVDILRTIQNQEKCEIGAHLHPWCNPPYFGKTGEFESHVVNLPEEQVRAKLSQLVCLLKDKFGRSPQAFRTGRWGINEMVFKLLHDQGFTVDSSVYPNWENEFFSCHGAPELPYWPDFENPLQSSAQRNIFELPVTNGFNRTNYPVANKIHQFISAPNIQWARLVALAWHTRMLRKTYMSPELSAVEDMINLCDMTIKKGIPVIHMFLHSSSLVDNPNSLIGNHDAFTFISKAIKEVVKHLQQNHTIEFCTISEASHKLQTRTKD